MRAFVVAALVVAAFLGLDSFDVEIGRVLSFHVIDRHDASRVPWLSALWLTPLLTAVVVARIHDASWARVFARGGAALTLALSIAVVRRFRPELDGLQFVETLPGQLVGLSYHLGVDGISATLVFLQALVVTLLLVALGRRTRRSALVSLLTLHAVGLLGLVSVNLLVVALVTMLRVLPAALLIGHSAPEAGARVSTKWFVRPMLVSTVLLLAVVLAMGTATGSFDFERIAEHGLDQNTQALAFVPFMIAVAIRLPLVPFHGWLIRLIEGSPALAAVPIALAPAGHYLFLRIGLELLGDAVGRHTVVLASLAVASMLYCVLVGLAQASLRSSLAYFQLAISSSLLVGVASADPMGPTAGLLNACNLAIAGTGLLVIADIVHARVGTTDFAALGGLVRTAPTLTGLFLVISLAYAGFPGTLGFVAEHLASHGAFDAHPAVAMTMLAAVNLASVVLWWSFARACLGPWRQPHLAKFADLLARERVVLLAIAVIVIGAGWWLEPWVAMVAPTLSAHVPHP
ncbi:MAG: proton-conducting transporter membrane subunit [Nannocystaceae bacterium]